MVPEPILTEKIPPEQRFSSAKLARDLNDQGIKAFCFPNSNRLLEDLVARTRPGDVVLFMSNGAFDNLPKRFLTELR
jgi:UDP-N-acetylmuramate: L-alanyl-gamma-D-glutamyl-meso-diaminopimelate ligase